MKVLLLGAGGQGAPCASILANDSDISEILLADINLEMAKKVAEKVNSPKLSAMQVDAKNIDEVAELAKDKDCIIDLVSLDFTSYIMKAALKANVHYVNSAFSREIWDYDLKQGKLPKLYDEFCSINKTALLGCGMSAGYTNVIVRYYADKLDTMKSVKIRLAKFDSSLSECEQILKPWNPGWNPKIAFMDFVNSTTIFDNGEFKTFDKPFSGLEEWEFPAPLGKTYVAFHAHEEPYSMPTTFADKGLQYCDFKYYVNKQVAPLVALGFGDNKEIQVKGTKVNPLDVLLELVPDSTQSFLNDNPELFESKDENNHVSIMIEIIGEKNGKEKKYLVTFSDMNKPRKTIYNLYKTTSINVALPTVIGMKMAVLGTKKGVIFSEELDPEKFISLLKATGYPNHWETIES